MTDFVKVWVWSSYPSRFNHLLTFLTKSFQIFLSKLTLNVWNEFHQLTLTEIHLCMTLTLREGGVREESGLESLFWCQGFYFIFNLILSIHSVIRCGIWVRCSGCIWLADGWVVILSCLSGSIIHELMDERVNELRVGPALPGLTLTYMLRHRSSFSSVQWLD